MYDITDFIKVHPGGSEKILLGAGGNLEPFFAFYPFHVKDHVQNILAKYKIGELHPDDRIKEERSSFDSSQGDGAFASSQNLRILQPLPLVAEVQPKFLATSFITPNDSFFLRSHNRITEKIDS